MLPDPHNIFKGALTENYILESLAAREIPGIYYKPDLEMDGEVIPVEIKSGRHKRSTSLKNYMQKYEPSRAYRLSELNFGVSGNLFSVPLYAAFCLG